MTLADFACWFLITSNIAHLLLQQSPHKYYFDKKATAQKRSALQTEEERGDEEEDEHHGHTAVSRPRQPRTATRGNAAAIYKLCFTLPKAEPEKITAEL